MAQRARLIAIHTQVLLLLLFLLISHIDEDLLILDHLFQELAEDFLRANLEGLLTVLAEGDELDTVIFWHDVLLNKLVFGATAQLVEAEVEGDLMLHLGF